MRFLHTSLRALAVLLFGSIIGQAGFAQQPGVAPIPHTKQIHLKHVLVIGQTKGFEHDSVSPAMVAIYELDENGLIKRWREYLDMADLTRKMGADEKFAAGGG